MSMGVIGNRSKTNDKNITLYTRNEYHALICKRIKPQSTVLIVGYNEIEGKILKNELECSVHGVYDNNSSKMDSFCDKTYTYNTLDLDDKNIKKFISDNNKYDYIVLNDVIDYASDPSSIVLFYIKYLKKNGKILLSLPNIANYKTINELLNEDFDSSNNGIMNHYTKLSFAKFIDNINKENKTSIDVLCYDHVIYKPEFYNNYTFINNAIIDNPSMLYSYNLFELSIDSECDNLKKLLKEDVINLTDSLENKLYVENNYRSLMKDYQELRKKNAMLCTELYNSYNSNRLTRIIKKPFNVLNDLVRLMLPKKDDKQSVLFFVHSWINLFDKKGTSIGGTTLYVLDIINRIKDDINCYVITIINDKYMLVAFDHDRQYIYDLNLYVKTNYYDEYDGDFYEMVNMIINSLDIDLLHVNHIKGFPCDLSLFSKTIPTIFTVHDYTFLCSRSFLLNANNELCSGPSYDKCSKCVFHYLKSSFELRQDAIENLLKNSVKVIVPDDTVAKKINNIYSIKNVFVIPHGMDIEMFSGFKLNTKHNTRRLNIAFVGSVDEHKGGKIIEDLVTNADGVHYNLFGVTANKYLLRNYDNYTYHGPYNRNNICKLLNKNKIDLVLFLNKCEETYSYTLSEVVYAGIPSLAFDLGAIGNRIKKDKLGWVIPYTEDYTKVVDMYSTVIKEYNTVKDNIDKYNTKTIGEYVDEIKEIYEGCYKNRRIKNTYNHYKFLHCFSLIRKR